MPDEPRTPYQLPFPADALEEVFDPRRHQQPEKRQRRLRCIDKRMPPVAPQEYDGSRLRLLNGLRVVDLYPAHALKEVDYLLMAVVGVRSHVATTWRDCLRPDGEGVLCTDLRAAQETAHEPVGRHWLPEALAVLQCTHECHALELCLSGRCSSSHWPLIPSRPRRPGAGPTLLAGRDSPMRRPSAIARRSPPVRCITWFIINSAA